MHLNRPIAFALAAMVPLAGCATFVGHKLVQDGETPGFIGIINHTGYDITALTISKCNAMSHGLSRISKPIPAGKSLGFNVGPGCWDVMIGADGYCYSTAQERGCTWKQALQKVNVVPNRRYHITFTAPR
jgi:hypothetical protein